MCPVIYMHVLIMFALWCVSCCVGTGWTAAYECHFHSSSRALPVVQCSEAQPRYVCWCMVLFVHAGPLVFAYIGYVDTLEGTYCLAVSKASALGSQLIYGSPYLL